MSIRGLGTFGVNAFYPTPGTLQSVRASARSFVGRGISMAPLAMLPFLAGCGAEDYFVGMTALFSAGATKLLASRRFWRSSVPASGTPIAQTATRTDMDAVMLPVDTTPEIASPMLAVLDPEPDAGPHDTLALGVIDGFLASNVSSGTLDGAESTAGIRIVADGPVMHYLVGPDGEKISDRFMDFKGYVFKSSDGPEIVLLVGRNAASAYLLRMDEQPLSVVTAEERFMDFKFDFAAGVLIGSNAVHRYIIDPATGKRAHNEWYWEIVKRDGVFYGRKLGAFAQFEPIRFNNPETARLLADGQASRLFLGDSSG